MLDVSADFPYLTYYPQTGYLIFATWDTILNIRVQIWHVGAVSARLGLNGHFPPLNEKQEQNLERLLMVSRR